MASWAAAFTALLFVVFVIQVRVPTLPNWFHTSDLLLLPGLMLAALLGLKGGTDAFNVNPLYAFPFFFLIYWLLLEIGYAVWRAISKWIAEGDAAA
jgi:hypothetical protein